MPSCRQPPPPPALAGPSAQRDLLAHGPVTLYWSADVVPTTDRRGSDLVTGVKTYRPIARRSAAMARDRPHQCRRDDRDLPIAAVSCWWRWRMGRGRSSPTTAPHRRPLPGGARILALCGDEDDIWAVGEAAKGQLIAIPPAKSTTKTTSTTTTTTLTTTATTATLSPATTKPLAASEPAAPITTPVPAFPPHELGLFLLRRRAGNGSSDVIPGNLHGGEALAVSMAIIDRRLMLAIAAKDLVVRIWRNAGHWDAGTEVAVLGERKDQASEHRRPGRVVGGGWKGQREQRRHALRSPRALERGEAFVPAPARQLRSPHARRGAGANSPARLRWSRADEGAALQRRRLAQRRSQGFCHALAARRRLAQPVVSARHRAGADHLDGRRDAAAPAVRMRGGAGG